MLENSSNQKKNITLEEIHNKILNVIIYCSSQVLMSNTLNQFILTKIN